jgi:hypothetical protein
MKYETRNARPFQPTDCSPDRRPYRSPRLERLGDLRNLTLGGSPGMGDSANSAIEAPLGF